MGKNWEFMAYWSQGTNQAPQLQLQKMQENNTSTLAKVLKTGVQGWKRKGEILAARQPQKAWDPNSEHNYTNLWLIVKLDMSKGDSQNLVNKRKKGFLNLRYY